MIDIKNSLYHLNSRHDTEEKLVNMRNKNIPKVYFLSVS